MKKTRVRVMSSFVWISSCCQTLARGVRVTVLVGLLGLGLPRVIFTYTRVDFSGQIPRNSCGHSWLRGCRVDFPGLLWSITTVNKVFYSSYSSVKISTQNDTPLICKLIDIVLEFFEMVNV